MFLARGGGVGYQRNIVWAEEEGYRTFSRDGFGARRRGGVAPQHCLGRGRRLQEVFA